MEIKDWQLHCQHFFAFKWLYVNSRYIFAKNQKNISLNVAASKIDKELLHKIMEAIMNETFDTDEELKLEIYNAINKINL